MTTVVNKHHKRTPKADQVYIGRPSKWGNPFVIGRDGDRATVIEKHRQSLLRKPELVAAARVELKDKELVCFCTPLPCHGDTWARIANGGEI